MPFKWHWRVPSSDGIWRVPARQLSQLGPWLLITARERSASNRSSALSSAPWPLTRKVWPGKRTRSPWTGGPQIVLESLKPEKTGPQQTRFWVIVTLGPSSMIPGGWACGTGGFDSGASFPPEEGLSCWTPVPRFVHMGSVVSAPCDPMDCRLPGSSVHESFLARILEWVASSYSRGSSPCHALIRQDRPGSPPRRYSFRLGPGVWILDLACPWQSFLPLGLSFSLGKQAGRWHRLGCRALPVCAPILSTS